MCLFFNQKKYFGQILSNLDLIEKAVHKFYEGKVWLSKNNTNYVTHLKS